MTTTQQARQDRLLPGGIPRWIRCYDNGGESFDRYTVLYTKINGYHAYVGMSEMPFHPQGFGQHGEHDCAIDAIDGVWPPAVGRKNHLGTRITFADLPTDCQKLVMNDYKDMWGLD